MKGVILLFLFGILWADSTDLDDSNFESFIQEHKAVMVEFYSPGCSRCKDFAPAYEEYMRIVKEKHLPYIAARVDITKAKETANKHSVGKLPILKLFFNGDMLPYTGEASTQYLLQFTEMAYKDFNPIIELDSEDELKERLTVRTPSMILIGGSQEDIEMFKKLPRKHTSVWFFHASQHLGKQVTPGVVKSPYIILVKDFEKLNTFYAGPFEEQAIDSFINTNNKPAITTLNQEIIGYLFKDTGKKGVILLREENEQGTQAEKILTKLAEEHRSEDVLFIVSDIESEIGKRVAKLLTISKTDLPHMEILQTKKKLERQKFEGVFTLEEMNKFIENWQITASKKTDL